MNKDKQIDEMANAYYEAMLKARETLGSMNEGAPKWYAKELYAKGYRKASEIFEEIEDFQRTLRHIFLDMCEENDYNTLNLLQIDSAIEALFDSRIAELKNKYTEDNGNDI